MISESGESECVRLSRAAKVLGVCVLHSAERN